MNFDDACDHADREQRSSKSVAHVTQCILSYNLKEIIELQAALAQQGISVTFQTAEIEVVGVTPLSGEKQADRPHHDPFQPDC